MLTTYRLRHSLIDAASHINVIDQQYFDFARNHCENYANLTSPQPKVTFPLAFKLFDV